jgi:hypothetical protein
VPFRVGGLSRWLADHRSRKPQHRRLPSGSDHTSVWWVIKIERGKSTAHLDLVLRALNELGITLTASTSETGTSPYRSRSKWASRSNRKHGGADPKPSRHSPDGASRHRSWLASAAAGDQRLSEAARILGREPNDRGALEGAPRRVLNGRDHVVCHGAPLEGRRLLQPPVELARDVRLSRASDRPRDPRPPGLRGGRR